MKVEENEQPRLKKQMKLSHLSFNYKRHQHVLSFEIKAVERLS